MSLVTGRSLYPERVNALEEEPWQLPTPSMSFPAWMASAPASGGDWGGYWGKQGPELLEHRLALYDEEQQMVFGANTFRLFVEMLASSTEESDVERPVGHQDDEPAGDRGLDHADKALSTGRTRPW